MVDAKQTNLLVVCVYRLLTSACGLGVAPFLSFYLARIQHVIGRLSDTNLRVASCRMLSLLLAGLQAAQRMSQSYQR
jgi:hypothetical protein